MRGILVTLLIVALIQICLSASQGSSLPSLSSGLLSPLQSYVPFTTGICQTLTSSKILQQNIFGFNITNVVGTVCSYING
ncbi:hypothetical protein CHUAL_009777 [Chamberlinius hualienensis]